MFYFSMESLPLSTEQWKPVVGYEGIFEVSDWGRVRRIKRGKGTRVGRILKGVMNNGYVRVGLWKKNSKRSSD